MVTKAANRPAIRASVTAAPQSVGALVSYPYAATQLTIVNTDALYGIEYRLSNSSAWTFLGKGVGTTVIPGADPSIFVRRIGDGSAAVPIEISGVDENATVPPKFLNRTGKASPMVLYTNAADFTIGGAGVTKADLYNTPAPPLSPSAIKVTHPAGQNVNGLLDRVLPVPIDIGGQDIFEIWFHVKTDSLLNGLEVRFSLSATPGNMTNSLRAQLITPAFFGDRGTGWNCLRWKKSDMEVVGTVDKNAASLPIAQIRLSSGNAAGGLEITYDSLWMNTKTRAKACLVFDDGYKEQYDFGNREGFFTMMNDAGFKGTIAVISGLINSSNYMTHEQCRIVDAAGWDLAVHGVGIYADNLTQLTEDEAIANIQLNRQFLKNQGYDRASDLYVYPQGRYTESLIAKMRAIGIKAARGTTATLAYSYFSPVDYMMRLPTIGIDNRTFDEIKPFIDRAIEIGGNIILTGHQITVALTAGATQVAVLKQIRDYLLLRAADIDTMPLSELVELSSNPTLLG